MSDHRTNSLIRGESIGGWIPDPMWLDPLAFLGCPDFQCRGPKTLISKGLGTSGRKIGAPQKREIQPQRIQPFRPPHMQCSEDFSVFLSFLSDPNVLHPPTLLSLGKTSKSSGISKPVVWGTRGLQCTLDSRGLRRFRRFRDFRRFRERRPARKPLDVSVRAIRIRIR